jgi:hypothetical protein
MAKQSAKELGMVEISFINANIYNPPHSILNQRVDGVICLQTLFWLGNWRKALEQLAKTNSKWIALSSLFYDGLLQANTCIINYDEDLKVIHRISYNVYSIPVVKNFLDKLGLTDIIFNPFQINLDLPRSDLNRVEIFTEKLEDGRRLQFSNPIVLPWYFLFSRRKAVL